MSNDELEHATWKNLACYEENRTVAFHARRGKGTRHLSRSGNDVRNSLGDFGEDHFSRVRGTRAEDGIRTPVRMN